MSTSAYYSFISNATDKAQAVHNTIEAQRRAAISPSSFATSSSNSNSSLNQSFNSLTPSSAASSSSSASSTSSSSHLTAASMVRSTTLNPATRAANQRDLIRQSSVTPTQMQSFRSYTLHSLEPKPLRPFKSRSEYLEAMKEDLAEWLNRLYNDLDLNSENFFSQLETGAIICRHAHNVTQMGRNAMLEQAASNENINSNENSIDSTGNHFSSPSPDDGEDHDQYKFHPKHHRHSTASSPISSTSSTIATENNRMNKQRSSLTGSFTCSPRAERIINWFRVKMVPYKMDAKPGTFIARDNICQFILWCRSLSIHECLLFETDDLVARKNEKSFILCLLEVARIGFKVGMPTPLIIQLEQEIDREIENDAKLHKQLSGEQVKIYDVNENIIGSGAKDASARSHVDHEDSLISLDDNSNIDDGNNSPSVDANSKHEKTAQETNDVQLESENGLPDANGDECSEGDSFGPKPQVVTNDLLSLHEKVSFWFEVERRHQ